MGDPRPGVVFADFLRERGVDLPPSAHLDSGWLAMEACAQMFKARESDVGEI